jgi:hypothetical protein
MTSIVYAVCDEFGITPARFFGRERNGVVSRARQAAILKLRDVGFTIAGMAKVTQLNPSTVSYWLGDDQRENRKSKAREANRLRNQRKKEGQYTRVSDSSEDHIYAGAV